MLHLSWLKINTYYVLEAHLGLLKNIGLFLVGVLLPSEIEAESGGGRMALAVIGELGL